MIKKGRSTHGHPCTRCGGKGVTAVPSAACTNCQGQGYIKNPSGPETVCPLCDGNGSETSNRRCDLCEGTGLTTGIYELTEEDHACLACGSKGWIDVNHCQVPCPKCYGNGSVTTYTYKTIH